MQAPARILPYVERFAREIVASQRQANLQYLEAVPHESEAGQSALDTLENLIVKHGGRIIGGWAIWERPKVYFEAEFTAVWQDLDGQRRFIRRLGMTTDRMLFLPDPRPPLDGRFVDNHRRPLTRDKQVIQYLKLSADRVALLRKAGLKTADQVIAKTESMRRIEQDIRRLLAIINERYGGWGG